MEEALTASKTFLYYGETNPTKDKVTIFNETLTWFELEVALELGEKIAQAINRQLQPGVDT